MTLVSFRRKKRVVVVVLFLAEKNTFLLLFRKYSKVSVSVILHNSVLFLCPRIGGILFGAMMMSRQLYSRTRKDAKSLFPSSSSLDTNNNNRESFCFFLCRRETPLLFLLLTEEAFVGSRRMGVEGILKRKRRLGFRVFRDEEKTSLF